MEERKSGMAEEMVAQEYYCSFDTGQIGSFYTQEMQRMRADKRIGDFPWMPDEQAVSVWDLGFRDDNFIIFAQPDGDYCRIIDCIGGSGRALPHWVKTVKEQPYVYARHWAPHDIEQHDYSTGMERIDVARKLGINFDVAPDMSLQDGIESTRTFLSRVRINESQCGPLIAALENYRREYDAKLKVFRKNPLHDWSSHAADCFRYLALSWHLNRWTDTVGAEVKSRFKVIRSLDAGPKRRTLPRSSFQHPFRGTRS